MEKNSDIKVWETVKVGSRLRISEIIVGIYVMDCGMVAARCNILHRSRGNAPKPRYTYDGI
jgi:hypothetical protein